MRLLLDTHIWIWAAADAHRLSASLVDVLSDTSNEFWLSPVSTWEIHTLASKKRLTFHADIHKWVATSISQGGFQEAPLTHEVVLNMPNIELPHRDPADWLLAATARTFDLTLVTADENILRGSGFSVLPNK